jgi:hypothetical protein
MKVQGNKIPAAGSPYVKPPVVSVVLGPGDTKVVTFNRLCEFFNDDIIAEIADGRLPLSISGKITYKDVFGESHFVECGAQFKANLLAFVADETKIDQ